MNKNEEYLSKKRAIELWDTGLIDDFEVGTFKSLADIHAYLFQDVFDFAGKIRTVNISKGSFRFAPLLFLESNLSIIEKMPENSFDEIIDKYVEMNVAHPFREGNGRAIRIWLDLILKKNLAKCIDWDKIDKFVYLSAMERSVVNTLEIKHLLKSALTDKIEDREVFMKGIDKSYLYEDLYDISIREIDKENHD
ncbi:Fic family protein [Anaerococcus sp. NML200537]|uniref:protein adenylyltransferase Fic n=1 Tax=Anaerococcus sp. NML200537 TaxID=2954485 RepID=UPI0022388CF5|nr:Fic family protein [Anaerococcus sp. NML200537]MCW6701989.1 Fic family protein [Anaerococcus sp. NML200537]